MILPLYVALEKIDDTFIEGASDLGAELDDLTDRI